MKTKWYGDIQVEWTEGEFHRLRAIKLGLIFDSQFARRMTGTTKQLMGSLSSQGLSLRAIAKQTGFSHTYVAKMLRELAQQQ